MKTKLKKINQNWQLIKIIFLKSMSKI